MFHRDGNRYLGRNTTTTDDKDPALTALVAARFAVQHNIPINVQFIWELEEEIGSPNFTSYIKRKRSTHLQGSPHIRHGLVISHQTSYALWIAWYNDHAHSLRNQL